MNRLVRTSASALFVMVIVIATAVQPIAAEADVTDDLIAKVKSHCTENLALLNRLHQTDAFLRNDRGELYQTVRKKLMLPFNQRLVTSELDDSNLIATTAQFNKQYNTFYSSYVRYDNTMSQLLDIDCVKEPVTFYTTLTRVREQRAKLNESDQALVTTIKTYKKQFDVVKDGFESQDTL